MVSRIPWLVSLMKNQKVVTMEFDEPVSEDELTLLPTQDNLLLPTSQLPTLRSQKRAAGPETDGTEDEEEAVFMPLPKQRRRAVRGTTSLEDTMVIPPPLPTLRRPRRPPGGLSLRRSKDERSRQSLEERIKWDESALMVAVDETGLPDAQQAFLATLKDPTYRKIMYIFGRSGLDPKYMLCHFVLYEVSRRWSHNAPSLVVHPCSKWPAMPAELEQCSTVIRRPLFMANAPATDRLRALRRTSPLYLHARRRIQYPIYDTPFIPRLPRAAVAVRPRDAPRLWDTTNPFFLDCSNDLGPPPSPMVPMEHSLELLHRLEDATHRVWDEVLSQWRTTAGPVQDDDPPEPYLDAHLTRVVAQRAQRQLSEMLDVLFDSQRRHPADEFGRGLTHGSMLRLARLTSIPEAVMTRVAERMRRVFPQTSTLFARTRDYLLSDASCFAPSVRSKLVRRGYCDHLANRERREHADPAEMRREWERRSKAIKAIHTRNLVLSRRKVYSIMVADRRRLFQHLRHLSRGLNPRKTAIVYDYRGFPENFPPDQPIPADLRLMPIEWKVRIVEDSLSDPTTLQDKLVVWGTYRRGGDETRCVRLHGETSIVTTIEKK